MACSSSGSPNTTHQQLLLLRPARWPAAPVRGISCPPAACSSRWPAAYSQVPPSAAVCPLLRIAWCCSILPACLLHLCAVFHVHLLLALLDGLQQLPLMLTVVSPTLHISCSLLLTGLLHLCFEQQATPHWMQLQHPEWLAAALVLCISRPPAACSSRWPAAAKDLPQTLTVVCPILRVSCSLLQTGLLHLCSASLDGLQPRCCSSCRLQVV
jgi:hypothetical protein